MQIKELNLKGKEGFVVAGELLHDGTEYLWNEQKQEVLVGHELQGILRKLMPFLIDAAGLEELIWRDGSIVRVLFKFKKGEEEFNKLILEGMIPLNEYGQKVNNAKHPWRIGEVSSDLLSALDELQIFLAAFLQTVAENKARDVLSLSPSISVSSGSNILFPEKNFNEVTVEDYQEIPLPPYGSESKSSGKRLRSLEDVTEDFGRIYHEDIRETTARAATAQIAGIPFELQ